MTNLIDFDNETDEEAEERLTPQNESGIPLWLFVVCVLLLASVILCSGVVR